MCQGFCRQGSWQRRPPLPPEVTTRSRTECLSRKTELKVCASPKCLLPIVRQSDWSVQSFLPHDFCTHRCALSSFLVTSSLHFPRYSSRHVQPFPGPVGLCGPTLQLASSSHRSKQRIHALWLCVAIYFFCRRCAIPLLRIRRQFSEHDGNKCLLSS